MSNYEQVPLRAVFREIFAGAWGVEPTPQAAANARVIRATDIDSTHRINVTTAALRRLSVRELQEKELKAGDLIIEVSGGSTGKPVGRAVLFQGGDGFVCSNFFRTARPNLARVDARYLAHYLQLVYSAPGIWKYQQQTTGIINLKLGAYLDQLVWLPCLPEQRRISEILDAADSHLSAIQEEFNKLMLVKQGLMEDLLTGKVRVTRSGELTG
jgi:type I restriction enzyme S subunit